MLYNETTGEWRNELPDHQKPAEWPQLTVCIDSGAIGRSGAAFARHKLKLNIHVWYDVIHRLIRDIRLTVEKACSGSLHKALLHMSFVWSLHMKPFGDRHWWEVKKETSLLRMLILGNFDND